MIKTYLGRDLFIFFYLPTKTPPSLLSPVTYLQILSTNIDICSASLEYHLRQTEEAQAPPESAKQTPERKIYQNSKAPREHWDRNNLRVHRQYL